MISVAPSPPPTDTYHASPAQESACPSRQALFDSTTVVLDGYVAEVDRYFNILIRKGS